MPGWSSKAAAFEPTELNMLRFALEYYKKIKNEALMPYILGKNLPAYNLEFLQAAIIVI